MRPLIDHNLSDPACIYSTLVYIQEQATKQGISFPCVTFDQPLWWKATALIEENNMNIVCRLGGFHLLMSFLGSIGMLMNGSGLDDILELIYAPNVISHIQSGKAYSRAIRGHMLISAALLKIIFEDIVQTEAISISDLEALAEIESKDDIEKIVHISKRIDDAVAQWLEDMSEYRTARYWYQYIHT